MICQLCSARSERVAWVKGQSQNQNWWVLQLRLMFAMFMVKHGSMLVTKWSPHGNITKSGT